MAITAMITSLLSDNYDNNNYCYHTNLPCSCLVGTFHNNYYCEKYQLNNYRVRFAQVTVYFYCAVSLLSLIVFLSSY